LQEVHAVTVSTMATVISTTSIILKTFFILYPPEQSHFLQNCSDNYFRSCFSFLS